MGKYAFPLNESGDKHLYIGRYKRDVPRSGIVMSDLSASFVLPRSSSKCVNLHVLMRRGPSRYEDEESHQFSRTITNGDISEAAYIDRQGHRTRSEVPHA